MPDYDYGMGKAVTGALALISLKQSAERERALVEHQRAIETTNTAYLKIAQDKEKREANIEDYKERELKAQEEDLKKSWDLTTEPAYLSAPPESQQFVLKYAESQGYTKQGMGTRRDRNKLLGDLEGSTKLFAPAMAPFVAASKKNVLEAWENLQKLREKPDQDPKKLQEAQQAFKKADDTYTMMAGNFDKGLATIKSKENTQEIIDDLKKSGQWDKMPQSVQLTLTNMQKTGDETGFKEVMGKWAGAELKEPAKPPSMGNAVELAVNRKFKDPSYLTNPTKHKLALDWLGTPEGIKAVQDAAKDVTPPAFSLTPTAEGFVPFTTRGPQAGTMGTSTGIGKPLSSEMVVAQQQIGTLQETLNRVKRTYDKSFVGPIGGRYGLVKEKWIGVPEKQASFYSDLAQIQNSLVYLLSGKQINEQEYKRLLRQLPTADLPESTFDARIDNFELTLNSIMEQRKKSMGGYGTQKLEKKDSLGIR